MDDIFKFRAWDISEKQMFEVRRINIESDLAQRYKSELNDNNSNNWLGIEQIRLMPCTGLRDVNRTLVFKNDIIKEDTNIAIIKFGFYTANNNKLYFIQEAYGFYLEYISHPGVIDHVSDFGCWEVIGNIYENPELLVKHNA